MSTKIYNGYYSNLSLEELLIEFKKFSEVVKKECQTVYLKSLIKDTIEHFDRLNQKGEPVIFKDLLIKKHEECQKKISSLKDFERAWGLVEMDLLTNCAVFPMEDKTLILWYCEIREITKLWNDLPFIHDYYYQNSTDRPDNISEAGWNKRIEDWNIALGGDGWGKPIDNGYIFTFHRREIPLLYIIEDKFVYDLNVVTGIPDSFVIPDEKRKKKILLSKLLNEHAVKLKEGVDAEQLYERSNFSISDYMNFEEGFRKKYDAGDYADELAKIELMPIDIKQISSVTDITYLSIN